MAKVVPHVHDPVLGEFADLTVSVESERPDFKPIYDIFVDLDLNLHIL